MKSKVSDLAGKFILASLGAVAMGKEKTEKFIDELVEKGEISKGEASGLIDELLKKGKKAQENLGVLVKKEAANIFKEANIPSQKDLDKLEKRIKRLESKLSR